jgi:hypothetical protein
VGHRVVITAADFKVLAELNETETAVAIKQILPIKGKAARWGGEIYFTIPVKAGSESGCREILEPGELGYWPAGSAFCIFFGPTPASEGDEIRAASAVNIIGKLLVDDLSRLWDVPDGADVVIEKD